MTWLPTRCLLAACFAGGVADTTVASPVDLDGAGASRFAVLSISSRAARSEAGQDASGNSRLAQARSNALRTAAATLERSSGTTSAARTRTVSGTAGVKAAVQKRGIKLGTSDTLILLGGQNKGEPPVLDVLTGRTTNLANTEVTASAALSDVLFNIRENAGVSWGDVANNGSLLAARKVPPGLLEHLSEWQDDVAGSEKDTAKRTRGNQKARK